MVALAPGVSVEVFWFGEQPSHLPHHEQQLLTRGIEHHQGVLLLLQGVPEVIPRQMQHTRLLFFPCGLRRWGRLRAEQARGWGTGMRRDYDTQVCPPPHPAY